jgi:hypothetical protein
MFLAAWMDGWMECSTDMIAWAVGIHNKEQTARIVVQQCNQNHSKE